MTATQVLLIIAGVFLIAFLICIIISRKFLSRKRVVDEEGKKSKYGFCYLFVELIFALFGGG